MSIQKRTNVDDLEPMAARIERVRQDLQLSRTEFCQRIGYSYSRYSHLTGSRRSKPSTDLLRAVAAHTDVSPDWLLSGQGPVYRRAGRSASPPARSVPAGADAAAPAGPGAGSRLDDSYVLLPLYGVQGGAGDGAMVDTEEVEDLLAFKREWITRELRSTPDDLSLIYVRGESMVPTLSPGDVILVERSHGAAVSDGIYVICTGDALLVKRLQFLPEGELVVTSDNPAYQPFRVSLKEQADDFAIIGRVVWAGRRF